MLAIVIAAAIPFAAVIYGKWVLVGSGLAFAAIYVLIRVETGVWIDEARDLPGKFRPYSETDPRNQRPEA